MSRKYKFADNNKMYFVSFAVINWIDLFIRNEYREIILESVRFCQQTKELELYGWCLMTSHAHLIIGTKGNPLQNIMRDLKRHTSEELHGLRLAARAVPAFAKKGTPALPSRNCEGGSVGGLNDARFRSFDEDPLRQNLAGTGDVARRKRLRLRAGGRPRRR